MCACAREFPGFCCETGAYNREHVDFTSSPFQAGYYLLLLACTLYTSGKLWTFETRRTNQRLGDRR